jgi:hypothetical protein
MSALFTPPRYSPMSGNGTSYPAAKLYFYETGTTTPKDTYNDADLDPAHVNANPVVADANGLFGVIYLGTGDYKVILKDASDNTLWTVDPQSGLGAADTLTTRGDLLTRDASGYSRLAIGTTGYYLASNGTDPYWASPIVPRLAIQGLTYANNGTDATNDIDIAVGGAMDSTSARMMVLAAALTKRLDAVWAVGTNQGGLDTGSASDTDYYIWLINRSDTDVTDVLFSTSATSPTMPTNYNYKRPIGWCKRVSGAIVAFKTYELSGGGLHFLWASPTIDVDLATTLTTSRRTDAIKVPVGFPVHATINVGIQNSTTPTYTLVYCPDQADLAPGATTSPTAPLQNVPYLTSSNNYAIQLRVWTDSTGKIAARASATVAQYAVVTVGFEWARR